MTCIENSLNVLLVCFYNLCVDFITLQHNVSIEWIFEQKALGLLQEDILKILII